MTVTLNLAPNLNPNPNPNPNSYQVRSLSKAVPMAISVFFNPGGTDIAQDAAVRDVIDKLRAASIAADALKAGHHAEEEKQGTVTNLLAGLAGSKKDGIWAAGEKAVRSASRYLGAARQI